MPPYLNYARQLWRRAVEEELDGTSCDGDKEAAILKVKTYHIKDTPADILSVLLV
jgi:hypothetical protein